MGKHCDPFWVALRSLTDRDCGQLAECLRRSDINVESCDPDGNTLLHYATVLGRKDMMRLLYKGYFVCVYTVYIYMHRLHCGCLPDMYVLMAARGCMVPGGGCRRMRQGMRACDLTNMSQFLHSALLNLPSQAKHGFTYVLLVIGHG